MRANDCSSAKGVFYRCRPLRLFEVRVAARCELRLCWVEAHKPVSVRVREGVTAPLRCGWCVGAARRSRQPVGHCIPPVSVWNAISLALSGMQRFSLHRGSISFTLRLRFDMNGNAIQLCTICFVFDSFFFCKKI